MIRLQLTKVTAYVTKKLYLDIDMDIHIDILSIYICTVSVLEHVFRTLIFWMIYLYMCICISITRWCK